MVKEKEMIADKAKMAVKILKSEDESILEKKAKLNEEYAKSYDKVEQCLIKSNMDLSERGRCMDEILDMMQRAQERGIAPKSIIGKNERKFTQDLINSRGDIRLITRICKEIVKMTATAFAAIFIYALMGMVNSDGLKGIYNDISIINAYLPAFLLMIIGNIYTYRCAVRYGRFSDEYASTKRLVGVMESLLAIVAYIVMEDAVNIRSYATTYERSLCLVAVTLVCALIIIVITRLGGFEIIYRRNNTSDLKGHNYELMLLGFVSQYKKRNVRLEKGNKKPLSVKDYAREIEKELKTFNKFFPICVAVLVLEMFLLGFLILGVGMKPVLIASMLLLAVATAVCISLTTTFQARYAILERVIENELDLEDFIEKSE